ncbi:MAG: ABC transporter permease, partial [Gemmatimonadaceae bacterium]
MTIGEIVGRLLAWRRRDELDDDLAADIEAHVELLARDLEHHGLSRADALAAARRQVGNTTSYREGSRDYWGFPALDVFLQDARYALRGLKRSPGFTATVILTLGLGIGANAAMFAVIDRLMFRPFPYMRDPSSVNRVYIETTYQGHTNANITFPYRRYLDLARATRTIEQVAALSEWRLAVGTGEDSRVRKVAGVSASFFAFFDAPPARGRYFQAAEDSTPVGAMVAVLSHAYWSSVFNSADVIGRRLKVGMLDYTIVGVAPPGFVGTVSGNAPDIFVPITTIPANLGAWSQQSYLANYNWDWTEVLVRRRPGATADMATAELTA